MGEAKFPHLESRRSRKKLRRQQETTKKVTKSVLLMSRVTILPCVNRHVSLKKECYDK